MKKLFNLLGLEVICEDTGKILGIASNVIIVNQNIPKIVAFVIDNGQDKNNLIIIPWHDIRFKENQSFATLKNQIEDLNLDELYKMNLLQKDDILNLRIFSDNGMELGHLKDIFINEIEGVVDAFHCSDGIFNDLVNGRITYPIIGGFEIKNGCVVIPKESVEESMPREELKNM